MWQDYPHSSALALGGALSLFFGLFGYYSYAKTVQERNDADNFMKSEGVRLDKPKQVPSLQITVTGELPWPEFRLS